jgi:CHAT domain-containing protein
MKKLDIIKKLVVEQDDKKSNKDKKMNDAHDLLRDYLKARDNQGAISRLQKIYTNYKNLKDDEKAILQTEANVARLKVSVRELRSFLEDEFERLIEDVKAKENKILFFASNPHNTPKLDLDKEVEKIQKGIKDFKAEFIYEIAELDNFFFPIIQHKPRYIHFSGHGKKQGEADEFDAHRAIGRLIFPDESGNAYVVNDHQIIDFFKEHADELDIEVVFLNACYSSALALEISKYNIHVIGMQEAIYDEYAIKFSANFYKYLQLPNFTVAKSFQLAKVNLTRNYNVPIIYFQGKQI